MGPHCVRGKAQKDMHRTGVHEKASLGDMAPIAIDYCFLVSCKYKVLTKLFYTSIATMVVMTAKVCGLEFGVVLDCVCHGFTPATSRL